MNVNGDVCVWYEATCSLDGTVRSYVVSGRTYYEARRAALQRFLSELRLPDSPTQRAVIRVSLRSTISGEAVPEFVTVALLVRELEAIRGLLRRSSLNRQTKTKCSRLLSGIREVLNSAEVS